MIGLVSVQMYHAFEQCKHLGALAQVHAENGDIIAEVRLSCEHVCVCVCRKKEVMQLMSVSNYLISLL